MKKKVFVSFDFDNDKALKDLLMGQAKNENSPFEIIDGSLKEASLEQDWLDKATVKIKSADLVIVILGTKTYKAPGVLKEIEIANEKSIKIVQLIGHPEKNCPKVGGAGRVYRWSWSNLKTMTE